MTAYTGICRNGSYVAQDPIDQPKEVHQPDKQEVRNDDTAQMDTQLFPDQCSCPASVRLIQNTTDLFPIEPVSRYSLEPPTP